ncbi:MAG: hypothetical protein ACHQPH_19905, partial [Reyranellales bacterium]
MLALFSRQATRLEGTVHVFDLEDHPKATRAYAWSSPIEGSNKRRFYAVLHLGSIRSCGASGKHGIGARGTPIELLILAGRRIPTIFPT